MNTRISIPSWGVPSCFLKHLHRSSPFRARLLTPQRHGKDRIDGPFGRLSCLDDDERRWQIKSTDARQRLGRRILASRIGGGGQYAIGGLLQAHNDSLGCLSAPRLTSAGARMWCVGWEASKRRFRSGVPTCRRAHTPPPRSLRNARVARRGREISAGLLTLLFFLDQPHVPPTQTSPGPRTGHPHRKRPNPAHCGRARIDGRPSQSGLGVAAHCICNNADVVKNN